MVTSFEINMPTKEEELVTFLSSDLFPIGEKTAEKIVNTFHEDTINKNPSLEFVKTLLFIYSFFSTAGII